MARRTKEVAEHILVGRERPAAKRRRRGQPQRGVSLNDALKAAVASELSRSAATLESGIDWSAV